MFIKLSYVVFVSCKYYKLLREYNAKITKPADRIIFQRQMMVQDAISLLSEDRVIKILKANFTEGELVTLGLSNLCIEAK